MLVEILIFSHAHRHAHDCTLIVQELWPDALPLLFDRFHIGAWRFERMFAALLLHAPRQVFGKGGEQRFTLGESPKFQPN